MIPDDGGAGFPAPPEGSPGVVRSAAASLQRAGAALDDVASGLDGASGALQADWQGYAASRYRDAASGLMAVAKAAGRTFQACSHAVAAYAGALADTQDQITRLRAEYEAARAAERAAATMIGSLTGQLGGATPAAAADIEDRISTLGSRQTGAAEDAERYARRARQVLAEFRREASRQEALLSGERVPGGVPAFGPGFIGGVPGVGSGLPPGVGSVGFGIPAGGLGPYQGVVPVGDPGNSDVPGFGAYWDSQHPVEEVDDLTNLVLALAGGVEVTGVKPLAQAAREVVAGGAERLGITGGRAAAERADEQAWRQTYAQFDRMSTSIRERVVAANRARRDAIVQQQLKHQAARATTIEKAADLAGRLGVKLPPGTPEVLGNLTRYSDHYRLYVLAQLMRARAALEERNADRAAQAVTKLIDAATR